MEPRQLARLVDSVGACVDGFHMLPSIAKYRSFSLRSRASLIAATVLLQALVIGLGWFFTSHVASNGVSQRLVDQRTDENAKVVERVASIVVRDIAEHGNAESLHYQSKAWERAQTTIEQYRLSGGASLFLVGRDGVVLCHPDLRENPNMRRADYADLVIKLNPSGETWLLSNLNSQSVLTGRAEVMGIPILVALRYVPELDAKVVVIQSEDAILAAGKNMTASAMLWSGIAVLCVLGLTTLGSILLVRRYDSLLSRANRVLEAEVARRTRRAVAIRNGLIFGLAKLADYRDTDTGKHLERICRYCETLARQLKPTNIEITEAWIEQLKLASSLHDIGKVGIPDSILLKPGKLTAHERSLMEKHAAMGADTLIAIRKRVGTDELLDMSIVVALQHHEKFDGKGYPFGLAGEQIALAARIVACADIYDALTSPRVYKPAMTHEAARKIIVDSRGTHLDPTVVDAFEAVQGTFDAFRRELMPESGAVEITPLAALVEKALQAAIEDVDVPRGCIVPNRVIVDGQTLRDMRADDGGYAMKPTRDAA